MESLIQLADCVGPRSKHPPQTLEFGLGVATTSKCGYNYLWLGGETLSQTQLPYNYKYKYLSMLVYLLVNHVVVLLVMGLYSWITFMLLMIPYVVHLCGNISPIYVLITYMYV